MFKKRLEMRSLDPETVPVQIIFLDYEMPIMDGKQVVQELFKIYEQEEGQANQTTFVRPTICCMSAHTNDNIR